MEGLLRDSPAPKSQFIEAKSWQVSMSLRSTLTMSGAPWRVRYMRRLGQLLSPHRTEEAFDPVELVAELRFVWSPPLHDWMGQFEK